MFEKLFAFKRSFFLQNNTVEEIIFDITNLRIHIVDTRYLDKSIIIIYNIQIGKY